MWIDYGRRITETVEDLARQERTLRGQAGGDRIRLLRWLKSGEDRSLARAATTLGDCERQVQRWWQRYTTSGVAGLLEIGRPGGRRERITAAAWAGLSEQMRAGQIGRLKDAQASLQEQGGLHYCLDALSKLFRRRRTKLKTGRPRHRRPSAAAQAAFKKAFGATLEAHQVRRVFALDEARFGVRVWHRRRWCPWGTRPPWVYEDRYAWLWLDVAVEPTTGESVILFLPHTDGRCFQRFLEELRRAVPDEPLGVVLDSSGSHTSGAVQWPAGLQRLPLPPSSPELNPAERWFEALRRTLANRIFDTLDDLEHALTDALQPYWDDPTQVIRLTAYPWWRDAVQMTTQNITTL